MKQKNSGLKLSQSLVAVFIIGLLTFFSLVVLNDNKEKFQDNKSVLELEKYFEKKNQYLNISIEDQIMKNKTLVFMNPIPESSNYNNCSPISLNHHMYQAAKGVTYTINYCLSSNTDTAPAI